MFHIQLALQTAWRASAQLVLVEAQILQVGEVAQLRRYLTAQLVISELQIYQGGARL